MGQLKKNSRIGVCSKSFSKNPALRNALLSKFENVKFNEEGVNFSAETLVAFLKGCEGAIVGLETLDEHIFSQVPELKVIGKYGVGLDKLNLAHFRKHGVHLGWTAGVNKRSVAELTLALMIMMLRKIPFAGHVAKHGPWHQVMGQDLTGKTVGLIGVGHVGRDVVELLKPFRCRLLLNDLIDLKNFAATHGAEIVSKEELYRQSDLISLHVPLTEQTRDLIGAEQFSLMKPTAILLNAARGGLVNEADLYQALKTQKIASAAFDVMVIEPPEFQPLFELDNFFLTPHIGGSSKEAILAMGLAAIAGLEQSSLPDVT